MNDRLDQEIRSLVASAVAAAPPAPALPDLDELPAVHRAAPASDRVGWIMAGAGIAAAAALVGVLVWTGDDEDRTIVAASTTVEPATTESVTVPPTDATTTPPTTVETTAPTTTPPAPTRPDVPSTVVTAGPDGVWRVVDGVAEQLVTEPMSMVLQLPDGSLIMQRESGWSIEYPAADTTLLGWSEAAGVYELLPGEETTTWLRLHDVAIVAEELTLLYSSEVEALPQAGSDSQLLARSLDSGEITVVAEEFGGWEQGFSRMHLAESGAIVGESYSEASRSFVSFAIGDAAPVDRTWLGVEESYADCEDCPRLFTASRDSTFVAWLDGTRLIRDAVGDGEYPAVELGDAALNVSDLDVGRDYVVLTYYSYPEALPPRVVEFDFSTGAIVDSSEVPGEVAAAVVDPTPPWQVDDELTATLAGQEFATADEAFAAVEEQIAALKYGPNEDVFEYRRRTLADGSQAIVAPNFDDSVPESWYRPIASLIDGVYVFERVDVVAVCRNFTFSTPTHLCV